VDKQTLLAQGRLPEEDVTLPVGVVHVRGLSRKEMLALRLPLPEGVTTEQRILTVGMVDPALTLEEVGEWQAVAPSGEIEAVCDTIARLSGAGEGAQKSYLP
jgi:hypothetical protein